MALCPYFFFFLRGCKSTTSRKTRNSDKFSFTSCRFGKHCTEASFNAPLSLFHSLPSRMNVCLHFRPLQFGSANVSEADAKRDAKPACRGFGGLRAGTAWPPTVWGPFSLHLTAFPKVTPGGETARSVLPFPAEESRFHSAARLIPR